MTATARLTDPTEAWAEAYRTDGYLLFRQFLPPDMVANARAALSNLLAAGLAGAAMSGTHDEVYSRHVASEMRDLYLQFESAQTEAACDPTDRVRKIMNFHSRQPFRELLAPAGAVGAVARRLLGADPILMHCLAQLKPPRIGREKGWHQDSSYFSVVPITQVIGIWIALDDAHADNGCLRVLPGWHRRGPLRHELRDECQIEAGLIDARENRSIPMKSGDAIAFDGLLPHGSGPNRSHDRRWALTFHFRGAATRIVSNAEFAAAFTDETGAPAGCAAAAARATREAQALWSDQ